MNNNLESKLKEFKKGYLKKLEDIILGFKTLLNDKDINIEELYKKVHTISGTSGMYGLKEISDISTEFEFYLKLLKENIGIINEDELKNKILNFINDIEKIALTGD